jgi:hypothetical protein
VVPEPKASLPCSQEPTTSPYPMPTASTSYPPPSANLPTIHSNPILSSKHLSSEWSLSFRIIYIYYIYISSLPWEGGVNKQTYSTLDYVMVIAKCSQRLMSTFKYLNCHSGRQDYQEYLLCCNQKSIFMKYIQKYLILVFQHSDIIISTVSFI